MTAYCTVTDVRYALVQAAATSGTNTAADMDDATIQDSVNEASSQVDAYVGGTYDLTTTPPDFIPPYIKYWTRDIAAFLAASVFRKSKDWTTLDPLYIRWQDTLTVLNAVNAGLMGIIGPGNQGVLTDNASVVNWTPIQLFTPCDFDLWGKGYTGPGVAVYNPPVYYYYGPGFGYCWPVG